MDIVNEQNIVMILILMGLSLISNIYFIIIKPLQRWWKHHKRYKTAPGKNEFISITKEVDLGGFGEISIMDMCDYHHWIKTYAYEKLNNSRTTNLFTMGDAQKIYKKYKWVRKRKSNINTKRINYKKIQNEIWKTELYFKT